jgi:hypothetical protein
MIGKVITGRSFGGCIRYVVQKHDAVLLDAAGVRMQQVNQIINDFNLQRKYNPNLGKAVGHIALSWSVNDAIKLTDELMVNLAKEYLQKMKILDTQYLIVKHRDKDHPHIHIVYNRVSNNGKTISDNFQKQRNVQVTKELTLKHGLYMSPGKEQVNRQQLKGQDRVKYELFDAIKSVSKKVKSIDELKQALAKQGIVTHLKYKGGSNEVQGISFSKGNYKFKGSEIDRSLSYGRLNQAIAQNMLQEKTEQLKRQRSATSLKATFPSQTFNQPKIHLAGKGASLLETLLLPDQNNPVPQMADIPDRRKRKKRKQQGQVISR